MNYLDGRNRCRWVKERTRVITLLLIFFAISLSSCSTTEHFAPVLDASNIEKMPKSGIHQVRAGETLYAIAWRYGLDYRHLARRNQLKSPYVIHAGQKLDLSGSGAIAYPSVPLDASHLQTQWILPAKGKVIGGYSERNKGIDISGHLGDGVYAAQQGKVVYCGDGLRGYGNLIILKHAGEYLSAYANNESVLVKEGQQVKKGQKIAKMGKSEAGQVALHFEIRQRGAPLDPSLLMRF